MHDDSAGITHLCNSFTEIASPLIEIVSNQSISPVSQFRGRLRHPGKWSWGKKSETFVILAKSCRILSAPTTARAAYQVSNGAINKTIDTSTK